jgi:hypothetical protein
MTDNWDQADHSADFMGGGGAPAVKFEAPGDTVSGIVTKVDKRIDSTPDGTTKTWPDGSPMHVFIFTLDTDDGERSLWVRGNMVTAVREAVRNAGLPGPLNTRLTVRFTEVGEPKAKGYSGAKLFKAKCEAVAPAAAGGGEDW